MVRVGVVQAGSYVYDTPKTLEKLEKLVVEASQKGAQIVLFPEAFIGGYPAGRTFGANISAQPVQDREEFKRYFEAAIEFHGPESDKIGEIARKNNIHIVLGVIERDGTTLYCSVFFYGPDGTKLGKHRKLMPTVLERIVWGMGDGSTIPVLDTSVGKIGAVICWENYMPLLRTHMYSKGVQLYFAPTADDRETWLSNMRTFAMEGRCFVISACQFLLASNFPKDNPAYLDPQQDKILMRGGSCVVNPMGEVILEPDFTKEKVAVVDCDLSEIIAAKFDLDTVGHYSRPDVFQLIVNEKPQNNVTIEK